MFWSKLHPWLTGIAKMSTGKGAFDRIPTCSLNLDVKVAVNGRQGFQFYLCNLEGIGVPIKESRGEFSVDLELEARYCFAREPTVDASDLKSARGSHVSRAYEMNLLDEENLLESEYVFSRIKSSKLGKVKFPFASLVDVVYISFRQIAILLQVAPTLQLLAQLSIDRSALYDKLRACFRGIAEND
jgi:hypothetical protein